MAERMGSEISRMEGRDYNMEIGTENDQLNLLLKQTKSEIKNIRSLEQKQRARVRMEAIREVLTHNENYVEVRRRIDKIREREESGIRVMPTGEIKQPEEGNLKSKYEYDVLNALMMRVVDEVKLLQKDGADRELTLAKQKGRALKMARDNTEYGYIRSGEKSAA